MESLANFLISITKENPDADTSLISKAYKYAMVAHSGQKRATGEDFFIHPYGVVTILIKNRILDTSSICAALLHDIVEDTSISVEQVATEFNREIADIVEGLTKLDKREFLDRNEYKAENMRKIILATAKDPRVMIVKLCDRLHNMSTLQEFRKEKQNRIAKDTLQVYAPIAEKLGFPGLKGQLQDWALRYLDPDMYYFLKKQVKIKRVEREQKVVELVDDVNKLLNKNHVKATSIGRAKYFYSIARKMRTHNKTLEQIYDLYGLRIIVDTKHACYVVLELLKQSWKFQKDRFKDYIEHPKANQYQSIHANFIVDDKVVEIQIRTREMDDLAESGIATHWKYKKTARDKKFDQKINWLRQLLQRFTVDSNRPSGELHIDVFKNQIILVTPKGDPIILPEGSSAIDFAYAVHTSIGNHAVKAKVNDVIVPLSASLKSGDIVNVMTGKQMAVSRTWLKYAHSSEAASKIRRALNMNVDANSGERARKREKQRKSIRANISTLAQLEKVTGKTPIKISKCCSPKLGSNIVAFYTKGKKLITVHTAECPNQYALDQRFKLKMDWAEESTTGHSLEIVAKDTAGLLRNILEVIFTCDVKVKNISFRETKNNLLISIGIHAISDEKKCEKVLSELRAIKGVFAATIDD